VKGTDYAKDLPETRGDNRLTANVKTALMLAFIAAIFFVAVVIRHWIW